MTAHWTHEITGLSTSGYPLVQRVPLAPGAPDNEDPADRRARLEKFASAAEERFHETFPGAEISTALWVYTDKGEASGV